MIYTFDSGVFLGIANGEKGYELAVKEVEEAIKPGNTITLSTITLNEVLTPFLRVNEERKGLKIVETIKSLKPKVKFIDVNEEISLRAAEYRAKIKTIENRFLALADSIILATAVIAESDYLITTDPDFLLVDVVNIKGPGLTLKDWLKKYGSRKVKEKIKEAEAKGKI